jgi:hypothetical protein
MPRVHKPAAKKTTKRRLLGRRGSKARGTMPRALPDSKLPADMKLEALLHTPIDVLYKACGGGSGAKRVVKVCARLDRAFWESYAASYDVDLPASSRAWTTNAQYAQHIRCLVSWRNAWRRLVFSARNLAGTDALGLHYNFFTEAKSMECFAPTVNCQLKPAEEYRFGQKVLDARALANARSLADFSAVFGHCADFAVTKMRGQKHTARAVSALPAIDL